MDFIYLSVCSSSWMGGDGVQLQGVGYRYFSQLDCDYHFIRVHETLMQHPSNKISIILHDIDPLMSNYQIIKDLTKLFKS